MKIRLFIQIGILAVGVVLLQNVVAQSIQDGFNQQQQDYGTLEQQRGAVLGNNAPAPIAPAVPTAQQQMQLQGAQMMGNAVGQAIGQALFGSPQSEAQQRAQQLAIQAQQQRMLAAQQLNNSGVYLLRQKNYTGAINEFQKALVLTPGDQNILNNIALAKQKIKDTAVAAQNSDALGQLLGDATAGSSTFNFDQLTHSSVANPNASALSLVNLDSDPNVVDLRDATKTSVDPASLKSQLDEVFANGASASAPSADMQQTLQTLDNLLDDKNTKSDKEFLKQEDPAWTELMRNIKSKLPPPTPENTNHIGGIGIRG
jgi:tetratricopeptide (TPR) repeat protein